MQQLPQYRFDRSKICSLAVNKGLKPKSKQNLSNKYRYIIIIKYKKFTLIILHQS